MRHCILFIFLISHLAGIAKTAIPPDVSAALEKAGNNRISLEWVLKRYEKDPEKYKAACFLIANMPFYHQQGRVSNVDPMAEQFRHAADSIYCYFLKNLSDEKRNIPDTVKALRSLEAEFRKKVQATRFADPHVVAEHLPDITTLDSTFLIEHIEHAFALRTYSPLVRQLSFEDFCNWVLPYRSTDFYPFVFPATLFFKWFDHHLRTNETDSVQLIADRYKHAENHLRSFLGKYPFSDHIGAAELFWNGVHDCVDIANYGANVMRACGVPALVGYNSSNKLYTGHHYHVAVIDKKGRWCTFSPETNLPMFRDQRFTQSTNILYIYFGKRKNNPAGLCEKGEPLPPNLDNPCIEDHTERIMKTVRLTLPYEAVVPNRLAYLATFNSQVGLQAVTWGLVDKKKKQVTFEKVVPEQVYYPVYCIGGNKLKAFGCPFRIKNNENAPDSFRMESIVQDTESEKISVQLQRKFPVKPASRRLAEQTIGTIVIASHKADFKKADTLACITHTPLCDWQDLELNNTTAYPYYRIVSPPKDPHIRLSEVEFLTLASYGYTNVMEASPLMQGGDRDSADYVRLLAEPLSKCRWRKEYDGNVQTAPEAYPSINFHLKKPQVVNKLRYAIKHAGNAITYGDSYQLFVWEEGEWRLQWTRMAAAKGLPAATLETGKIYWLHDLTQGTEEMPFTIDRKGTQHFISAWLLK